MNEKDFLEQLNSLKNIEPSSDFKRVNREVLLNQLSSSKEPEKLTGFSWVHSILINLPSQTARGLSQPVIVVLFIAIFILSGGLMGIRAAQNTKPGDSLYIAKIASEKTQQALTFGDKNKIKLGLEFAGNRAKELNQVLAETVENSEVKDKVVEKLKSDFRKEIIVAKNRIVKISAETREQEGTVKLGEQAGGIIEEGSAVFSANLTKEETGIQTSEPAETVEENIEPEKVLETKAVEVAKEVVEAEATTSSTVIATGTEVVVEEENVKPEDLLEQAGFLLSNEDYDATLSKLDEAGLVMDMVNEESVVKGTSTEVLIEKSVKDGETLGVEEAVVTEDNKASSTEE